MKKVGILLLLVLIIPIHSYGREPTTPLLALAKGVLKVNSSVEGAKVFIDGVEEGKTPFIKMLPPGRYRVRVVKSGYEEVEKEIIVLSGKVATFEAILVKNTGSLEIKTNIAGIRVFMEDKEIGVTPIPLLENIKEGRYTLRFEKEDWAPYYTVAEVKRDTTSKVYVALKPLKGWVSFLSTPPSLSLKVDGQKAGVTPVHRLPLSEGLHIFEVGGGEYPIHYGKIEVIPGEYKKVSITASKRGAGLKVFSDIPGAKVYLNENLIGETPLRLKKIINPSKYEWRIEKEGFDEARGSLTLVEGEIAELKVFLKGGKRFDLERSTVKKKRIYERWWFWTAASLIISGAGGGGYLYYINNIEESPHSDITFILP